MAITSDGTQSFGIQDSPVTINSITYVLENANFTYGSNRVDINDSNGEPLGSTVIPGRRECTGTLQLAANTTASKVRQHEFVISATNSDLDGTYLITECSEAQTQGDYVKVSFTAYQKVN